MGFDEDGVGRAGPRAQLAADALFQAVGVTVELVAPVETNGPSKGYCSVTVGRKNDVIVTPYPATGAKNSLTGPR